MTVALHIIARSIVINHLQGNHVILDRTKYSELSELRYVTSFANFLPLSASQFRDWPNREGTRFCNQILLDCNILASFFTVT